MPEQRLLCVESMGNCAAAAKSPQSDLTDLDSADSPGEPAEPVPSLAQVSTPIQLSADGEDSRGLADAGGFSSCASSPAAGSAAASTNLEGSPGWFGGGIPQLELQLDDYTEGERFKVRLRQTDADRGLAPMLPRRLVAALNQALQTFLAENQGGGIGCSTSVAASAAASSRPSGSGPQRAYEAGVVSNTWCSVGKTGLLDLSVKVVFDLGSAVEEAIDPLLFVERMQGEGEPPLFECEDKMSIARGLPFNSGYRITKHPIESRWHVQQASGDHWATLARSEPDYTNNRVPLMSAWEPYSEEGLSSPGVQGAQIRGVLQIQPELNFAFSPTLQVSTDTCLCCGRCVCVQAMESFDQWLGSKLRGWGSTESKFCTRHLDSGAAAAAATNS